MKFISFCLAICLAACQQGLGPVEPKSRVERQMIGLLHKFDRWDDNGDGQLNEAELQAGLAGTSYRPSGVLDFYDTNHNGKISLSEAQAGYHRAAEAEQRVKEREAAFKKLP